MSGPFDNARYEALLEGLEISVLSLTQWRSSNENGRWDSEYFAKENLRVYKLIAALKHTSLSKLVTRIQHPAEIERTYEETGLHIVLAQNVRDNWFNFSDRAYMPNGVEDLISQNWIHTDDVLMTRSGANCGQTACWKYSEKAFTCADILMFRSPKCPGGYLSTFLNTAQGRRLVLRGAYGMAQPHIAPSYLEQLLVPRFEQFEKEVDHFVTGSVQKFDEAEQLMIRAEQTLLDALGLVDWHPPEPLTYTRSSKDVLAAGRFDSEFFNPKFDDLIARINKCGECVPLKGLLAYTQRGKQPVYTSVGLPVVNSKHVLRNEVVLDNGNACAEKIPDAQQIQLDDVVINGTGVGTIGRAAAYLHSTPAIPDNHVTILRIKNGAADAVYLSVYLNSIAGQIQVNKWLHGSSGQIEIYPGDIEQFKLWLAPDSTQQSIRKMVEDSFNARKDARALLSRAQRAVEVAIEEGEAAGMAVLEGGDHV